MRARDGVDDPAEVGRSDQGREGREGVQDEHPGEGVAIGPHILTQRGPDVCGVGDGYAGAHCAACWSRVAVVRETTAR
jgi:hypothetical protein